MFFPEEMPTARPSSLASFCAIKMESPSDTFITLSKEIRMGASQHPGIFYAFAVHFNYFL